MEHGRRGTFHGLRKSRDPREISPPLLLWRWLMAISVRILFMVC